MGFWNKLFSAGEEEEQELVDVELSLDELKSQVNESLKRVNDLGEKDYAKPVINQLTKIKSVIKALMSRSLNNDYNKALLIGANNARKRVKNQLMPLLELGEPGNLLEINEFIKKVEKVLIKASEVSKQSNHAKVIFRDDMNKLGSAFDELNELVIDLKDSVSERNEQLDSFNSLVKELKAFDRARERLDEIKKQEFSLRKRISSYERDKVFFTDEISRIKKTDTFEELNKLDARLKTIKKNKLKLENSMATLVSKFSRVVRKAFHNDEFVKEFLTKPLKYIIEHEGEFNKRMSKLINLIENDKIKLSSKNKNKYLKALSSDKIDDYITAYNELLKEEKSLKNRDFSMLKRAEAFERRLIDLKKQVNKDLKELDSFKERINSQKREIEALKAKVEAMATECYTEKVRLL